MTILKNCDPKVLLAAVDRLEERYKRYYENFKKIVIKENTEYRKNFLFKEIHHRTPEEALAYGMKLQKNIETDNKFKKSFVAMKFFRNNMNMAIACNALVELDTVDDIGVYIRDEDFNSNNLNVSVPVTV